MLLYNSKKKCNLLSIYEIMGLKTQSKVIPAVYFIISKENKSKYEGVPFPPYFLLLWRHCEF